MTRNSDTTTNRNSYVQGFRPSDKDRDVSLTRRSTRLNATKSETAPPPRGTIMVMPTAATMVAHCKTQAHDESITLQPQAQAHATL
ncbi:hypothetical protein TB1_039839 [Malus domestica]